MVPDLPDRKHNPYRVGLSKDGRPEGDNRFQGRVPETTLNLKGGTGGQGRGVRLDVLETGVRGERKVCRGRPVVLVVGGGFRDGSRFS